MTPGTLLPPDLAAPLVELRRDLHRHPELSGVEHRTRDRLMAALVALAGVDASGVEVVGGTGLVARVRGRDPGAPVVAVRGDIDALPVQEETGLPYASEVPGVMHACPCGGFLFSGE
ncbi:MAG TPA: M20/M25/M40 family metallo-hydrolase [Gemmatimonadales bacterium]